MRYTKFTIENYKGIPKIELELTKKPGHNIFTLVGLNESGKTTILEAINLFFEDISKDNVHQIIPKSKKHSFTGEVKIKAEIVIDGSDFEYYKNKLLSHKFILSSSSETVVISKIYKFNKSIPADTETWQNTLYATSFKGKTRQAKSEKRLVEWNKGIWDEIINDFATKLPKVIYYPNFLFDFPERIYLEEYENEGKEQKEYRRVVEDILQSMDSSLTLVGDLLEKAKMGDTSPAHKEALEQLLLKVSSKLNSEILTDWDEILKLKQKKSVDIKCIPERLPNGASRYYLEFKIKQGSDSYDINERSLGFRWFFSFLIFTAFRKNRSSDFGETLFLLDEPASNLHQGSQKRLLFSLNKIFDKTKLIYSTHSHHLINPKWLSGVYIVKNNAKDLEENENNIEATLYKNFVSKYPDEQDHFKPILDALDYTPSHLELVPDLIFTEGKNDYYTFKYFSDLILKRKLHFFPGAGKDKYELPFRLYLAWGKSFIAVFDGDRGGKEAKQKYMDEIGKEIVDRVFTISDIKTAWDGFETEDLFTENEKIKIIQYSFPEHKKESGYNKSKFNTSMQQLYIDNHILTFNKSTVSAFESVFNFLEGKLSDLKNN